MARGEYLGAKEFNKRLTELMDRVYRAIPELGDMVAEEIAAKAVENSKQIIENGTGMDDHWPDTPKLTKNLRGGSTQEVLDESGMLKDSIYVVDKLFSRTNVIIVIGSYMPYAQYHEEGFVAKIPKNTYSKVEPRPFLKPGLEKALRDAFRFGLESRIRRALKAKVAGKNWKKFFK